ncbi:ribonuclease R [Anaerotignum lactatifermentans]|uniref:Ribonuclease R n=1 Tax=Anaerotignum lactatifermentans TaxID=160404 RepID=A0ABS2G6L3_9FIRM|nr:ribonuclease R [Anaerotignum lactatifermentans]MBM6828774.1 ribonuclease R [Anaerotignum lactatifermentans]MBM6877101.1 ribonuclease R [Anaerotignum lactatifermentans]MBM6950356.1 ribonuclease R [Anaerotignum lactatifermentans]
MEKDIWTIRKEKILALMETEAYTPMKRKEIRRLMEVPEEDREDFDRMIEELKEEGSVFETKKGKLASPRALQMARGTFLSHAKGFGFVAPENGGEDVFIPAAETNGAMQQDKVLYKVTGRSGGGKRAEGVIIKVLERGLNRIVGLYEQGKGFGFVIADDRKIGKDIFIAREDSMGAVSGHKVVVEITDYGDERRNPEGKITEILGHINDPGVDILSVIRRYELPVEFPGEVYDQIQNLETEVREEDKEGREDLRDVLTITIDGADAKDLDDAVSLRKLHNGNYELGVHIADVSHYVPEGTPLDKEAYARGTSVYLVDRVIPMLPHKLSNGICSLNPETDRLTMSCIMEIDEKGNVAHYRIVNSVIYSNYRMTYMAVREILEDKTPELLEKYAEIVPMLEEMNELRQILGEKRKRRGSVNFDLPESKIILDEEGKPVEIRPEDRNIATNLIEEFMLVCNETVAESFFWQEVPFVFRSHQEPDEEKTEKMEQFLRGFGYYVRKKDGEIHPREFQRILSQAEGKPEERIITRMVLRSMMQARYTADNQGHFGLAAKYYCHFTSPIRRYPDLEIHRLIKLILAGEMAGKREENYRKKMPEIALHCSRRERIAEDAERDTDDLKKVEYMLDKIGQSYRGIISGVTNWGIYVELENTVEGMVALSQMDDDYYAFDERTMQVVGRCSQKAYRLGDQVQVVVTKVSKELGTVDFAFVEEDEAEM